MCCIGVLFNFQFSIFNYACAQNDDSARIVLAVDARGFFQDDEYFGLHAVGYTLPGFYLRPKVEWHVSPSATLEAGVHWLHFWGAHGYPAGTTFGVWPQDDSLRSAAHLLPWFRADIALADGLTLTLGDLHSDDGHRLPLPLYDPERLFAADPEAGVQLRLKGNHVDVDLWVDWQEYIWRGSTTQEHFTAGLCAEVQLPLGKGWSLRIPAATVGQHTGGQGLVQHMPVQNRFNTTVGMAVEHHWCSGWRIAARADFLTSHRSGAALFAHGTGFYPTLDVACRHLKATVGYWYGDGFVPLLGSDLFSSLSPVDGSALNPTRMLTAMLRYRWHDGQTVSADIEGRYYYYLETGHLSQFAIGITASLNPKLTLLR